MKTTVNDKGERISSSWYAIAGQTIKCPYPGCSHSTSLVITKHHCRLEHGMEREQVGKLYGMPRVFESKGAILSDNNGRKWNSTAGASSDFSL